MHITVTKEGLARAGDKFWGLFYISQTSLFFFSSLPLVLHSFYISLQFFFFYFAANCLDPGAPYQGKTIDQDFRHGRTVRFTCPRNYTIEGVAAIKCTDGQWNNNKPSCKGKRPSVTLLEKQTNIHNKTNQAHQKAFASAIERKKVVLRLRQT